MKFKKLCILIDLEKAYARVPTEILKWVLINKGLSKVYVTVNKDIYAVCE